MTAQPRTPRERAEACYAVARSTKHAGEQAAAIGRGDAICARHGLPLSDFDVPGRSRSRPERSFRKSATSFRFVEVKASSLGEFVERLGEALAGARDRAGAGEDETPHDAQARNFAAECAAAKDRDRARKSARG